MCAFVLDGARADWGDKCWPPSRSEGIHVRPGLERPLRDVYSELTTVHWWSASADAPAAGGGIQPGFRRTVYIRTTLPTPPPTPFEPLQPCTAFPSLRRCGDQCSRHDELRAGRPAVGTILWNRHVSVQPAQTGMWNICSHLLSFYCNGLSLNFSLPLSFLRPFASLSSLKWPWVLLLLYHLELGLLLGPP